MTPEAKSDPGMLEIHAAQYYLAGRYAAICGFVPVFGMLFHHALDMALKAVILRQHPEMDELAATRYFKKSFGHSLAKLWAEAKPLAPLARLDELDSVVAKLDQFEEVRYPLNGILTGIGLTIEPGNPVFGEPEDGRPFKNIWVSLDELDALMARVWRVFGLPVGYLKWQADPTRLAEGVYSMRNRMPLYPPEVVVYSERFKVDEFPHLP